MKITFLGTSHGVPAADRYCSCTMLEVNGAHYFIDAGAPLIDLLLRRHVDLNSVKTIFTTHFHSDHVDGLVSFAGLCSWYFKTTTPRIYVTEQKGMAAMKALLEAAIGSFDGERVRFEMMTPDTVYEDENIRVTPFPTQHLASAGRPAYSYLVEAEGKKVFFSGDLSVHLEKKDFPAYVLDNEVDLMI